GAGAGAGEAGAPGGGGARVRRAPPPPAVAAATWAGRPAGVGPASAATDGQPPSAGLIGVVPMVVVVGMVSCGGPALTGRIGRHSTAGLAAIAAAALMVAQLDQGVGRGHPELGSERGIGGGPVGKQRRRTGMQPRFLLGL